MRFLASILLALLFAVPAFADELPQIVSDGADATALTIYPDNLALITEVRKIDLPAGKSTIVFEGVNDRMIAASAMLRAFSGFSIERNFDYALLNKANLFERSVGEYVTLTRTHGKSGKVTRDQAKIVSVGNGVVFDIDGKVEVFQCSGLSEGTWFENLPEGLTDKPKLSIDVDADEAGPRDVVISYLADRFSWKSDYRLDLNSDEKTGGLNGWLTINNQTSQTFTKAPTAIIAGRVNRDYRTRAQEKVNKSLYANCWPRQSTQTPIPIEPSLYAERKFDDSIIVTGTRIESESYAAEAPVVAMDMLQKRSNKEATQEEFGDYKLYRTAEPVTVAAYQTKQVIFTNTPDVEVDKFYTMDIDLRWLRNRQNIPPVVPTTVEYRLDNSRDGKLAKPLPKGVMRVLTRNADEKLLVIGQTNVVDTAVDNPMKIYLEESHLVQIQTIVNDYKDYKMEDGRHRYEYAMTHTITNASDSPAQVELNLIGTYKSFRLSNENVEMDPEVGPRAWSVAVAPNISFDLTYTARYDD